MSKFEKSVTPIMHDASVPGVKNESDLLPGFDGESYEAKGARHQVGLLFFAAPFILAMVLIVAVEAIRHSLS